MKKGGEMRQASPRLFQSSQQISLVHHAEKVDFILFSTLLGGFAIANDDVKGAAAASLDGE